MIAAHALGVQYGGDYLFRDATFMISPGDRIGLVGANGAGKTTLMRTLIGMRSPDDGSVARSRHASIGYLPQEGIVLSDSSVRQEVMRAFDDLLELEDAISDLNTRVAAAAHANDPKLNDLLEELGEVQTRYESMNGFAAVGDVEKVLMGLGFTPEDLDRPCREFSGGWQMRIELAKLLLRSPDLLMLDEPTNHLDIESLMWLEGFLQRYSGALLLISHDRTFLNALTTRIFELAAKRLTPYTGNFDRFLEEREERRELQQAAYENQQKKIADTQKFIDRFRYKATKSRQVQSRVKMLERLERVEELDPESSGIHFAFPPAPRSGRVVAEVRKLHKWYGSNHVLHGVEFAVERGEKVAFLGRNGEGKSTLARIIAGIESYDGERELGHNVAVGYFAQHQAESLNPKQTVLETLDAVASGDIRTRLRTLLGAFLFNGDDVFKPVGVLSGGEKSRLALAKLLLEPVNLLILDEPTNHLDMLSKEVLKNAIAQFEGATVIVSHDRDFLDGLADRCVEFKDGAIRSYLGGIDEYLQRHSSASVDDALGTKPLPKGGTKQKNESAAPKEDDRERKRREAELRNKRYAATKEVKKKLERAEKEIAALEEENTAIEESLGTEEVYGSPERSRTAQERKLAIENKLVTLYDTWGKLAAEIERIENEIGGGD